MLGELVARNILTTESNEAARIHCVPRTWDHNRVHRFPPRRIRHPEDGGFQDGSGCAAWRTAAGDNMSDLIHSLGGPYGTCRNQPIEGHYP